MDVFNSIKKIFGQLRFFLKIIEYKNSPPCLRREAHKTGFIFFTIYLFFFLVLSCGCDFLYRLVDKKGAQEKALLGEIIPSQSNPKVVEIQKLLRLYGYDPGRIDGLLGLKTRSAIAEFQQDNGLEVSRVIDQQTYARLILFKEAGFIVEHKLDTLKIQKLLKEAGFNPGVFDGKLGANTKQAVKSFQKAHNLEVDGKIGYKTLQVLARYELSLKREIIEK